MIGTIDFREFVAGMAILNRGSAEDRLRLMVTKKKCFFKKNQLNWNVNFNFFVLFE